MADITQISDSVKKSYVELPDGTFAEKVVAVNSDGTAISGGGGGGGVSATIFESPLSSGTVTVTMDAPTLGKIYFYNQAYNPASLGTVSFVPTLLPEEDTAYFLGVEILGSGAVNTVSEGPAYQINVANADLHSLEFIYTGNIEFSGSVIAIYNVKQFVRMS